MGKQLGVNLNYRNHSGFISCFVLKFINLNNPVFVLKGFDLAIGCQKAYIEPSFSRLTKEKAITIKCVLKNASFLTAEKKFNAEDILFTPISGDIPSLVERLGNVLYDTIHAKFIIYKDEVRFPFYEAYSRDVKLLASGMASKKGDLNISMRIFFSPEIAAQFPEELRAMLTEKSNGWVGYFLHLERGMDKAFLKFESDRLKLNFERVEPK